MLEAVYILLPLIAIVAYYLGTLRRKNIKQQISTKFSRSYLTTVDLLLGNKQKKAIELINELVKKPVDGESSVSQETIDSLLFLANLYRSTGELDKALNNYHKILSIKTLDHNIEKMVRNYTAQCYFRIGIYNRAEEIFLDLKNDPEYYYSASRRLTRLYIATKEWRKALILVKELDKRDPTEERKKLLAILYCFYLDVIQYELTEDQIFKTFNRILKLNPSNRLAHILLARYYSRYGSYQFALDEYKKVLRKDPGVLLLIINELIQLFIHIKKDNGFLDFLKELSSSSHKIPLCIYATKSAEHLKKLFAEGMPAEDYVAAIERLSSKLLTRFANEHDMDYLIIAQSLKSSLIGHQLIDPARELEITSYSLGLGVKEFKLQRFQCNSCGYRTKSILWICPNCRSLDSFNVPENKLN